MRCNVFKGRPHYPYAFVHISITQQSSRWEKGTENSFNGVEQNIGVRSGVSYYLILLIHVRFDSIDVHIFGLRMNELPQAPFCSSGFS